MRRNGRRTRAVVWCFGGMFAAALCLSWAYIRFAIPDHLNLVVSEEEFFHFALPPGVEFESESAEVVLGNESNIPKGQVRIDSTEPIAMRGTTEGSYQIGLNLFGLIRMKDIQVDVVGDRYAVPGGSPVGIYLKADGVMVIGTGEVVSDAGNAVEPAYGLLKSGDYIEKVNGQPIDDKEALIEAVHASNGSPVKLEVRRDATDVNIDLTPVLTEDGTYKLGAWVRDDTQGIGTMTYVTPDGAFGALGHGISDSDTGKRVDVASGELYETEILGIQKGETGQPGVMAGAIYYGPGSKLGDVTVNSDEGIFGTVNERFSGNLEAEAIPIGYRQDVKKGPAVIRSSVSGELKEYAIEIQRVDHAAVQKNKGMTIRIVDEELLELTGGIVQGMSGSPIIQDGKLIGAVTHVLVNDPTRGYGIFIENMLDAAA